MWMLLLVSWWVVTVSSLRSHSWKQATSVRPRLHASKRGSHFCVRSTLGSTRTRLYAEQTSGFVNSVDPTVEVYSTLGCKYCKKAKATLDEMGISYLTIDITPESGNADQMVVACADDGEEKKLEKAIRRRRIAHARSSTVPQIYVTHSLTSSNNVVTDDAGDAGDRVGGCDDLMKEIEAGLFQSRLGKGGGEGSKLGGIKSNVPAVAVNVMASSSSSSSSSSPPPPHPSATPTPTFTSGSYLNQVALALVPDVKPLSTKGLALGSERFDALSLSKALQTQVW